MDTVEQDDVTDPQEAAPRSGNASRVGAENNDENNNTIVSNDQNNVSEDIRTAEVVMAETGEEGEVTTLPDEPAVAEAVIETTEDTVQEGTIDDEPGTEEANVADTDKNEEKESEEKLIKEEEGMIDNKEEAEVVDEKMANSNELSDQGMPEEAKDIEQKGEPEVSAEDAADAKSEVESTAGGSLIPTPTPATKIRLNTRKHTTTPADDSGLAQPVLPTINKGQANVHQMTTSITHARRKQDGLVPISRQPVRHRVPPKLVRLATVTVSPAKSRPHKSASLYYEEPKRPAKVITWDQATNHRPPLRIDMEGPGPCSYSPLNKPLSETNAPCFTFGTKCYPEKDGGARTSWGKSWFQSSHLWHSKADYSREGLWPSPNHYPKPALLGPRQRTMTEAPSYTFGHKANFSIVKPGAAKEPSPNDYERQNADSLVLRRGPSFTHQFRREGTVLWGNSERTPAPCSYAPVPSHRIQRPAYTIQGIRREKSHVLGPYSTL